MKIFLHLLLSFPLLMLGQQEFPTYPKDEGSPLAYLDPEVSDPMQELIWIDGADFLGKYGFEDIFYVSREQKNHDGGMHQSWNITYLEWEEESFSEMWHVHYDTTYWEVDPFVKALPELADTRPVNGTDYYFNENGFLIDWGFVGYGSGSRLDVRCQGYAEGYYLPLFRTAENGLTGEAEEEFVGYIFMDHHGLPQHRMDMNAGRLELSAIYTYDPTGQFIGYKNEPSFVEKIKAAPLNPTNKAYQLYANGQHFSQQVKQAIGYLPQHILVGFGRLGYIRFSYSKISKKYFFAEIVPFF